MPAATTAAPTWGPMQLRATLSKRRSISGATRVKACAQNEYRGFLISSMKVMSRPQG